MTNHAEGSDPHAEGSDAGLQPAAIDHQHHPVAVSIPARAMLFLTVATLGCALDLWTKSVMFAWRGLPDQNPVWWVWPEYIGVQTALNTGAVFGIMSDWTHAFAWLSLAALGVILSWLFWGGAAQSRLHTVALACITAGILGNLYDRLGLWAPADLPDYYPRFAVRDWILFCYRGWVWPNFNIADSFLVCSTAVMAWVAWQTPTESAELSATTTLDSNTGPAESRSG